VSAEPADAGELLYAEDLPVGRRFEVGSRTLSAEEIKAFAREWDPLPFHVDEEAAAAGPFGGLAASGAHILAVYVRMTSDALVSRLAILGGRGVSELKFLQPVRPDVALTGTSTISRNESTRPGSALIHIRGELVDEGGEPVMLMTGEMLVRSRG
jgi:acyl dehydratase